MLPQTCVNRENRGSPVTHLLEESSTELDTGFPFTGPTSTSTKPVPNSECVSCDTDLQVRQYMSSALSVFYLMLPCFLPLLFPEFSCHV